MFGKLMKYEFKSNGKVLFPAFLVGIGGSVVLRFLHWMLLKIAPVIGPKAGEIFLGIVILYAIGIIFFTIGYVIVRFFQSMVGREAYLTLTLPLSNTLHIWAKFLNGLIFSLLGGCAAILTIMAYTIDGTFGSAFKLLTGDERTIIIAIILWAICLLLVTLTYNLMELFFCCAVGSQFKNKVVASVVTYFAASNAIGILSIVLLGSGAFLLRDRISEWGDKMERLAAADSFPVLGELMGVLWLFLLGYTIFSAIVFTIEFLVSRYLLTKKINIE